MIDQEIPTHKVNAGGYSWWDSEVFWSDGECLGHPGTWAGYFNGGKNIRDFLFSNLNYLLYTYQLS